MDFGHAGFRSFWEVIGFYGPQAGAHRGPLGTDAIQSGLARNHRNPFRLYCRLGLCHMVPQHAQLCCTSPCVGGCEIHFWFHTDHLCVLGGLFTAASWTFFPYVKFVELEPSSNRTLTYIIHIYIYRERERERERDLCYHYIHTYIYMSVSD